MCRKNGAAPPAQAGSQTGSMSLVFGVMIIVLLTSGLGLFQLMRTWHGQVAHQLRLDQCVRDAALTLQSTQARVERLNLLIHHGRLALMAGALAPAVQATLRTTIEGMAITQDVALKHWELRSLSWLTGLGCGKTMDLPGSLPALRWSRPLRDLQGPQPLVWSGPKPNSFRIERRHRPRASAAEVSWDEHRKKWKARWVPAGAKRD